MSLFRPAFLRLLCVGFVSSASCLLFHILPRFWSPLPGFPSLPPSPLIWLSSPLYFRLSPPSFFARPFRFPRPFVWQSSCHSFFGPLFLPPIIERAGLLLTCTETPQRLFGRPYHSFITSSRIRPPSAPSATESTDKFISRRIWKTLLDIWSITLVCVSHSRHLHRSRMLFGLSLPA